eukprot:s3055_g5.t1
MPGPWIEFANSRDFYRDFSLETGAYIETTLAHDVCQEGAHGLWQVAQEGQKEKDGIWATARLIAVSDVSLASWLSTGPGRNFNRQFRLHLCSMPMAGCQHRVMKHLDEFHSDCFRVVDTSDLKEGTIPWCVLAVSREEPGSELAMLIRAADRDHSHRGVDDQRAEGPGRSSPPGSSGSACGLDSTQSGREATQGANDGPFEGLDFVSGSNLKGTALERHEGGDFTTGESNRSRSPPPFRASSRASPPGLVKHDTNKGPVDSFSMPARKGETVRTQPSTSGLTGMSAGRVIDPRLRGEQVKASTSEPHSRDQPVLPSGADQVQPNLADISQGKTHPSARGQAHGDEPITASRRSPLRGNASGSEPLAERGRDEARSKRARSSGSACPPSPFTGLPPEPSAEENSEVSENLKPKEEGLGGRKEHQRLRPGSEWRTEGELGQRSTDASLVPKELAENPEGCPVNLLSLSLRIADDLQDWCCQAHAVSRMARAVNVNILSADTLMVHSQCLSLLTTRNDDQAGCPFRLLEDLDFIKFQRCLPGPNQIAACPLEAVLSPETSKALCDFSSLLLPREAIPFNAPRAKVSVSESEWFQIVRAAFERGLMKPVDEARVPRDRSGHLVTVGAAACFKEVVIDGQVMDGQWLVTDVSAVNAITSPPIEGQESFVFDGELTGFLEGMLTFGASDRLQSLCNLFGLPDEMLGLFSFALKVDGSAMGLPAGTKIRPALPVLPADWCGTSRVLLEATKEILFRKAKISKEKSQRKLAALPLSKGYGVPDPQWFDVLQVVLSVDHELSGKGKQHLNYAPLLREACIRDRLPGNVVERLIRAVAMGMQHLATEQNGSKLKLSPVKLRDFIQVSLALLSQPAGMDWLISQSMVWRVTVYLLSPARFKEVPMLASAADEVVVLCCQAPLGFIPIRVPHSEEISLTHATQSRGSSATASKLLAGVPGVPEKLPPSTSCGQCLTELGEQGFGGLGCPNDCGQLFCSLECTAAHRYVCGRGMLGKPCFGERFCSPNCPLTRAVANAGIFIQPPLGMSADDPWDFFSVTGRDCLEGLEDDGILVGSHWSPDHLTFSTDGARCSPTSQQQVEWPSALRSRDKPWGLQHLSRDSQVKVRQANSMARRSLQGVKEAHQRGRFASFGHPWDSYVWFTPEVQELCEMPGIFTTTFCLCCHGGQQPIWWSMVHNMAEVHTALHQPQCHGHWRGRQGVAANEAQFGVHLEPDELPWQLCMEYARALKSQMAMMAPRPFSAVWDEQTSIVSALRAASRGFQAPGRASHAYEMVANLLRGMDQGRERAHLKFLFGGFSNNNNLTAFTQAEDGSSTVLVPYPALRGATCGCDSGDIVVLFRQPWRVVGLRAVAEEALLSSARLVRAFANLDQSLGTQSAGTGSRAPGSSQAAGERPARSHRSRSPQRDTRPPIQRSQTVHRPERDDRKEAEETGSDQEEDEEEEEEEPPTEVKKEDHGHRRPPEPEGNPPRRREDREDRRPAGERSTERRHSDHHKSKAYKPANRRRRRGGAKHQHRKKDLQDPFRRSHRKLRQDILELAPSFEEGLARRY